MKKIFLILVLLFSVTFSWSQRNQIIAYIDMEYILENVPEYLKAQNILDAKVAKWRSKLDKQARHIEVLKTDLANEKAILTKDLIEEKEDEIDLKQQELRRLESLYFGSKGDMFLVRKQLVKPIQDQIYNAIQAISVRKKYDFVFDKSSDLVMLYSNKKYDISELVLATINRTRLIDEKNEKRNAKNGAPVFVNGHIAPLVGRVSMDMLTIDVTDIEKVTLGDTVELWGENLSVETVAEYLDTINYELLTRVSDRVPRVYVE